MGEFRTKEGWCVVEHGEIRLEPIGWWGRVKRGLENTKRGHRERYDRGRLRFVAVILFTLLSVGQIVYRVVFGDWQSTAFVFGIVAVVLVAIVGATAGIGFIAAVLRRRFRGYTADRTIPLRAVESVDPHPKQPLRRPYLVVHYDEYGDGIEEKRRVGICTQTPLAEGEFETAKAVLLDDHDLSITPA